jgi:hypothetical protein
MAYDQSGGANLSQKEREAGKRISRKRLGENGCPQDPPTPKEQDAANRTKMTVTKGPDPSPHETERAMGEK